MALVLFWVGVALILYHHVGYPLLLRLLVRNQGRPILALPCALSSEELPSVVIIVPAHNEAGYIAAKIENLCALNYPRGKLSVVIALDGCSDGTSEIALSTLECLRPGFDVRVIGDNRHLGKIPVLNARIGETKAEIVALSDVSALISSDALLLAAKRFADPATGVVCGAYEVAGSSLEGERVYWTYQSRLKQLESDVASTMGAHGAFYLFRRNLWSPLPADTINDDFVLPMRLVLQGYNCVYEASIVARETESSAIRQDFFRRVRIGAGNFQQAVWLVRLLNPRRGRVALIFFSGKALRAAMPVLLSVVAVAALSLAFSGSAAFAGVALAGAGAIVLGCLEAVGLAKVLPRQAVWVAYVAQGHVALALGTLLFLTGLKRRAWRVSEVGKRRESRQTDGIDGNHGELSRRAES